MESAGWCVRIAFENATFAAVMLHQQIAANHAEYLRLLADPNYTNVQFNAATGALMAAHTQHCFDPKRGFSEREVQRVGYENGHSVILGAERGDVYRLRYNDGTWDGKGFEIASAENATPKNIRNALKHCAKKPNTDIAVLFFSNDNFDIKKLEEGMKWFNGLEKLNDGQYKQFEQIICIGNGCILYKKSRISG